MHNTQPGTPPWHARASVRNLTAVVSLSLATLAVVLAFRNAYPAPDASPPAGWVSHFNQVGKALADESASSHSSAAPSAASIPSAASPGDPSVPAITFHPNATDAAVPAAPTF